MNTSMKRGLLGAALALALSTVGCRGAAKLLVSDAMEEGMGSGVAEQMQQQFKVLEESSPVTAWARELVGHLANSSERDRASEGFGGYKVYVIDDKDLVNAFAAPGGYLFLTTALIQKAEHCAEVAGVMAHELAHITNRHSVEQMGDRIALVVATSVLFDGGVMASIGSNLLANGFGRAQEAEADQDGLRYLADAGYNPRGMADFFGKLAQDEGALERFTVILSTHPTSSSRMKDMRKIAEGLNTAFNLDGLEGTECRGTTLSFEQVKELI